MRSLLLDISPRPSRPAAGQRPSSDEDLAFAPLTELAALGDELGLGMQDDDILSPEDAFQVSADSPDGRRLQVQWTIADGTYLYADKIALTLAGDGVQLGEGEVAFRVPVLDQRPRAGAQRRVLE